MGPLYRSASGGFGKALASEAYNGKQHFQEMVRIALIKWPLIEEAVQFPTPDFGSVRYSTNRRF
jgi:hypothetical protein